MGAGERFMTCLFSLDLGEFDCFDGALASRFKRCALPKKGLIPVLLEDEDQTPMTAFLVVSPNISAI